MGLVEITLGWIASQKFGTWFAPLLKVTERLAKRPSFESNPADLIAAFADQATDRGQLREALRGAIDEGHTDLWLWERTVDRLLNDIVGQGTPSKQAIARLELVCQQLYEEGWTTPWQVAYSGGLEGVERCLWHTAATRLSQQLDSKQIARVFKDLSEGSVSSAPEDSSWKILNALGPGHPGHRPLLNKDSRPSGGTRTFNLRVPEHRKASARVAKEWARTIDQPKKLSRQFVTATLLVPLILGAPLYIFQYWRVHRSVAKSAGDLLTTEPYQGLGPITNRLRYPGAAEDFIATLNDKSQSAARPFFLLHRQDALAQAVSAVLLENPSRARRLVQRTVEQCGSQSNGALCEAIHGFVSTPADERKTKELSPKEFADVFWRGSCVATRLKRAIESRRSGGDVCACSTSNCIDGKTCEVFADETKPERDEEEFDNVDYDQAIETGYKLRLTQIALRRLTCTSAISPPQDVSAPLESLELGAAYIPGDLPVKTRNALDFSLAVAGRTSAIRDVAIDTTEANSTRKLAKALLKIAKREVHETSDPATLSLIFDRTRGDGLQELWELASYSPEADDPLIVSARGLLKAPLALEASDWRTAAENGSFIAAAELALQDRSGLRHMVAEGGCGFHCLAGLVGAVCGKPSKGPLLRLKSLAKATHIRSESKPCAELLSDKLSLKKNT